MDGSTPYPVGRICILASVGVAEEDEVPDDSLRVGDKGGGEGTTGPSLYKYSGTGDGTPLTSGVGMKIGC